MELQVGLKIRVVGFRIEGSRVLGIYLGALIVRVLAAPGPLWLRGLVYVHGIAFGTAIGKRKLPLWSRGLWRLTKRCGSPLSVEPFHETQSERTSSKW